MGLVQSSETMPRLSTGPQHKPFINSFYLQLFSIFLQITDSQVANSSCIIECKEEDGNTTCISNCSQSEGKEKSIIESGKIYNSRLNIFVYTSISGLSVLMVAYAIY